MKFCRSTLFEAGGALFMNNWMLYSRKTSMVLTVKAVLYLISSPLKNIQMADKYVAKPSRSLLQLAILSVNMRRITYDSHFSNSRHFRFYWTKKHFTSEWYFTKNHHIGSLVVRKVKTSWDSRQNRELGPASRGSRRAIADLFGVMFIAWTSQKASKVHKLLSQRWPQF